MYCNKQLTVLGSCLHVSHHRHTYIYSLCTCLLQIYLECTCIFIVYILYANVQFEVHTHAVFHTRTCRRWRTLGFPNQGPVSHIWIHVFTHFHIKTASSPPLHIYTTPTLNNTVRTTSCTVRETGPYKWMHT